MQNLPQAILELAASGELTPSLLDLMEAEQCYQLAHGQPQLKVCALLEGTTDGTLIFRTPPNDFNGRQTAH